MLFACHYRWLGICVSRNHLYLLVAVHRCSNNVLLFFACVCVYDMRAWISIKYVWWNAPSKWKIKWVSLSLTHKRTEFECKCLCVMCIVYVCVCVCVAENKSPFVDCLNISNTNARQPGISSRTYNHKTLENYNYCTLSLLHGRYVLSSLMWMESIVLTCFYYFITCICQHNCIRIVYKIKALIEVIRRKL